MLTLGRSLNFLCSVLWLKGVITASVLKHPRWTRGYLTCIVNSLFGQSTCQIFVNTDLWITAMLFGILCNEYRRLVRGLVDIVSVWGRLDCATPIQCIRVWLSSRTVVRVTPSLCSSRVREPDPVIRCV